MREVAFTDWLLDLTAEVMPDARPWHVNLRTLGDLEAWGWQARLEATPEAVWRRLERDLLALGAPRALVRPETEIEDLFD